MILIGKNPVEIHDIETTMIDDELLFFVLVTEMKKDAKVIHNRLLKRKSNCV